MAAILLFGVCCDLRVIHHTHGLLQVFSAIQDTQTYTHKTFSRNACFVQHSTNSENSEHATFIRLHVGVTHYCTRMTLIALFCRPPSNTNSSHPRSGTVRDHETVNIEQPEYTQRTNYLRGHGKHLMAAASSEEQQGRESCHTSLPEPARTNHDHHPASASSPR